MRPLPRSAWTLTILAMAMAIVASIATLAWGGAFPVVRPALAVNTVLAEARGWSLATLAVAAPIAVRAMVAEARGPGVRARVVWAGALSYLIYTYLEFAVSPPLTVLSPVYVLSFAAALPALVLIASAIDLRALPTALRPLLSRTIIAFDALVGLGLCASWGRDLATRFRTGDVGWLPPDGMVRHVVEALDLGLQVPFAFGAAILLLRKRPAAFLVAGAHLTLCVCMATALAAMVASSNLAAGRSAFAAAPFALLALVAWALARRLLRLAGPMDARRG